MRRQRRSFKLLALLFGLTLIAAACGDDDEGGGGTTTTGGDTTETTAAVTGGTVVVAGEQLPSSVNFAHVEHNAFWTALWMQHIWPYVSNFQPDGTFVFNEDLVSAELTNEDPQEVTYTFTDEATWSDGTPVTADDLVFTWETSNGELGPEVDPETGAQLPLYNSAGTTGYDIQTCVAESEKVAVCTYDEGYADWFALFNPVLPRHAFEAEGAGDTVAGFNNGFLYPDVNLDNVPSAGPMIIEAIDGETSLTLGRNPEYWGEPMALDEIIIRWITDPTQEPAALENQEVDVIFPQAQIDLVQQTEGIAGVTYEIDFGTFFEHMDFNFRNVHIAKKEVRQAIGKALDRAEIVERLPAQFDPSAEVMNHHFYYPGGAAYQPNGEEEYSAQDIEAAQALLEDAGYVLGSDGIYAHPTDGPLNVRLEYRTPNPRREQTAALVQAQLAEAGIGLTIDPKPDFTFLGTGDFDIALFGWTSITVVSGHTDIFSTTGGSNNGQYSNPEVDELFNQADAELDEETRAELLNEVDTILWDDLPVIPLFQVPEFLAWNERVGNVEHNGYNGFMYNAPRWTAA